MRLDRDGFARAGAEVFAYLNQAHPFREGNGRTSKVFMKHVAERSRFTLDFSRVSPEVWNQANMLSGPDLGRYEPVPDSLVPIFRVIAQPRATGPSNPSTDMGRSTVRASYPQVTAEETRRSSAAIQQQRPSRRPGRGQGSQGVER
ncbi:Fic family protein [Actinomyces qiguomingii]|uniref:Fic family protein n=1 Tax=Actinomyces qiguomingii TaxID=2057800 RepID=UPI0018ECF2B2